MQLSFAPLLARTSIFSFKQGLSGALTSITTIGAISVVAFNVANTKDSLVKALEPLSKLLKDSSLLNGISELGSKLHSWGSAIVGTKDAFKEWLSNYLGPHGFKAGVAKLYQKLYDWAYIVYSWFRDKFLIFIQKIPDMVKNWDKLRLSLFKWGTFLGGGGGAALWAALGGGADLSKLGDLVNHPKFGEMMENFNTLLQENQEALEELGEDGLKEIFEAYLEDPEKANEAAKELNKEKQERKEKAEQEAQQNPEEQEKKSDKLEAEEIIEKFRPSQTGNPPTRAAVLGSMVKESLNDLLKPASIYSFDSHQERAKKALNKYLTKLKADIDKYPNKSKIKKEFLEIVDKKREEFIKGLSEAAETAYKRFEKQQKQQDDEDLKKLTDEFIKALTVPSKDGKGNADQLVKALT